MKFHSQAGQDRFVFETFFRGRRDGTFVDIGADDGERFSNTLFFEQFMGWGGLCVEPSAHAFAKLAATRRARCEPVCVADFDGEAEFLERDPGGDENMPNGLVRGIDPRRRARIDAAASSRQTRTVKVRKLSSLLAEHGLFHVDYCSIDTGGAAFDILSDLDPARFHVSVLTVDNSIGDDRISPLMAEKGYDFVGRLAPDLVFKRRDMRRLPASSVICAVWQGDPLRFDLLRGHAANLRRQTVPVEPIYVFDGGDAVPDWLDGRAVSVRQNLTIYQAWNVGLSLVDTGLVMNFNLDDRLAPDAVQMLENVLWQEDAWAIGGDWNIRYTQASTDAVEPCRAVQDVPITATWPPAQGAVARLGSGTGETGTFGPAVMWRTQAHVGVPRYPWRFADGTPIRKVGDAAWWALLQHHLHKKVVRLPLIIGNYHSHPGDQAEFRALAHDEQRLLTEIGISLI